MMTGTEEHFLSLSLVSQDQLVGKCLHRSPQQTSTLPRWDSLWSMWAAKWRHPEFQNCQSLSFGSVLRRHWKLEQDLHCAEFDLGHSTIPVTAHGWLPEELLPEECLHHLVGAPQALLSALVQTGREVLLQKALRSDLVMTFPQA